MLQVKNATPFKAGLMLLPDREGIDTLFTVVKATFTLGERARPADEQLPIVVADEHYGDPAASSIRVPSDVCLGKPGTDVLVIGSAWAPGGRPAWQADVAVAVGSVAKTVRVFGDRVWEGGVGAAFAWVTPFERMPLAWERAYGGWDTTSSGPTAEPRNPVGAGFHPRGGARPVAGAPLPNVEDPGALISSVGDAPPPAGFAPVSPGWLPRRSFSGTYDDAWQKTRAPYLPDDFDLRYFQLAPPGLVTRGYLQGGEPVELRGLTPSGVERFPLPTVRLGVTYDVDGHEHARPAVLDTVILEPDAARVVLVWRAALRCDKRALKVRSVATTLLPS